MRPLARPFRKDRSERTLFSGMARAGPKGRDFIARRGSSLRLLLRVRCGAREPSAEARLLSADVSRCTVSATLPGAALRLGTPAVCGTGTGGRTVFNWLVPRHDFSGPARRCGTWGARRCAASALTTTHRLSPTSAAIPDLFPDFLGSGRNDRTTSFFEPFIRWQKG